MISQLKKLNEGNVEQIMVCYKAGYSIYAIAKLMSVSPSTIRHHLQKMRIAIRKAEAYRVQPKAIKVRKPRKKK